MKIYLAGPMTGYANFNFPAFHKAAAWLRAQGHSVFNPAEHDVDRDGVDWGKEVASGSQAEAAAKGFSLRKALGDDLAFICAEGEGIAMLPGWEKSKGARAEHATAFALGLDIQLIPESVIV